MATPPRMTAADAAAAIGRITARHREIDDPDAWRLSDDPLDVLAYLRAYGMRQPPAIAEADLLDALVLRVWLWWTAEEAESWLLERAHRLKVPPSRVGKILGITTRQGVHDRRRIAREKTALLHNELPPEAYTAREQPPGDPVLTWIEDHQQELREIAEIAVAHQALADDQAAEWLVEVARDLRDGALTPGAVQTLRFALIDLYASSAVRDTAATHPLQAALNRWARLYATYPPHPPQETAGGASQAQT